MCTNLRQKCKRISEAKPRIIHPALFERLFLLTPLPRTRSLTSTKLASRVRLKCGWTLRAAHGFTQEQFIHYDQLRNMSASIRLMQCSLHSNFARQMAVAAICACGLSGKVRAADPATLAAPTTAKEKCIWKGGLLAGTAKINITPENTKQPVHDKVNARALVLEIDGKRLAFVSVDLGIYTSEHLVAACKEKFGLSQLVLSSSHTHSDPGGSYKEFLRRTDNAGIGRRRQKHVPCANFSRPPELSSTGLQSPDHS